jgi:6-phosphogluconolactonase (cycloisomerase 2 family)
MAAVVPSQFLFTADPSAGVILGFKINRDGGLSPVPGSPFVMADSPRLVAGTGENLFVAGRTKLILFVADKETGSIKKADVASVQEPAVLVADSPTGMVFASTLRGELAVRVVNHRMEISSVANAASGLARPQTSVIDATGRFMYTLNPDGATISVSSMRDGAREPTSLRSYPAGHGSTSLAILKP